MPGGNIHFQPLILMPGSQMQIYYLFSCHDRVYDAIISRLVLTQKNHNLQEEVLPPPVLSTEVEIGVISASGGQVVYVGNTPATSVDDVDVDGSCGGITKVSPSNVSVVKTVTLGSVRVFCPIITTPELEVIVCPSGRTVISTPRSVEVLLIPGGNKGVRVPAPSVDEDEVSNAVSAPSVAEVEVEAVKAAPAPSVAEVEVSNAVSAPSVAEVEVSNAVSAPSVAEVEAVKA